MPDTSSGPVRNVFDTMPHFTSSFTAVCVCLCVCVGSYCSYLQVIVSSNSFKSLNFIALTNFSVDVLQLVNNHKPVSGKKEKSLIVTEIVLCRSH